MSNQKNNITEIFPIVQRYHEDKFTLDELIKICADNLKGFIDEGKDYYMPTEENLNNMGNVFVMDEERINLFISMFDELNSINDFLKKVVIPTYKLYAKKYRPDINPDELTFRKLVLEPK